MKGNRRWSKKQLLDFKTRWQGVTIPVNIRIESSQIALDLTRTNQILMQAAKIVYGDDYE